LFDQASVSAQVIKGCKYNVSGSSGLLRTETSGLAYRPVPSTKELGFSINFLLF